MESPYKNKDQDEWLQITQKLILRHPLSKSEIVEVTLEAWEEIFRSKIGKQPFYIGRDIYPKPQIMGFFLHELIPLEFEKRYPGKWRKEKSAIDKDIIYIPDDTFSIEIKTSSDPKSIFGNRSYSQVGNIDKKKKSGYYLAVNFEKFLQELGKPKILKIRFGWLDHQDWLGQKSATGQQARLARKTENYKLIELYPEE